ncbi:MAG TPA: hypothetical protein DCG54_13205 [Anaerolineae bacterium]|jgi:hypothetical protein|nr:hypothetical protein [Anaerolineae bacterium]
MNSKIESLKSFVLGNIDSFVASGGGGHRTPKIEFDLYPEDYLRYADAAINLYLNDKTDDKTKGQHLATAISNINKALDCQIEMYLHAHNLRSLFKKRNLGIDKKLAFLAEAGIIRSRTLSHLNTARNKVEHEFTMPKFSLDEVEIYRDLVLTVTVVLQQQIAYLFSLGDVEMLICDSSDKEIGYFSIHYHTGKPIISARWRVNSVQESIDSDTNDIYEFAYFLKVMNLMRHFYNGIINSKNIKEELTA